MGGGNGAGLGDRIGSLHSPISCIPLMGPEGRDEGRGAVAELSAEAVAHVAKEKNNSDVMH